MRPLPVILAGGLGTRLGNLAEGLPKPMVPVAGQPFLAHVLRQLVSQGFKEALLLVGHRAEVIQDHFGTGDGLGLHLVYSREPAPLGTGGALRLARSLISQRFLLLYGDLYRPIDYATCTARHSGNALAVYPYVPGLTTISCANVGLSLDGHRVTAYLKNHPEAGLTHVDAGFGCFEPEVIDLLPEGNSSFESCIYPQLAEQESLAAIPVTRDFFDIGNPADLAHARAHFATLRKD